MKSERRHELKENELSNELVKLGGWIKKHGTALAWAAVLITLAIVAYQQFARSRTQNWGVWTQKFNQAVAPDAATAGADSTKTDDARIATLEEVYKQDDVDMLAAMAGVELGRIHARRALVADIDPTLRQANLTKARDYYNGVLAGYEDQPLARAQAHLGLAYLDLDKRDFAAARKHCNDLLLIEMTKGGLIAKQAEQLLERMDELDQPIPFATTMPVATQPADDAATQPAGPDATTQP